MKHDKKLISGFDANKRAVDRLKSEGFDVRYGDVSSMPFDDAQFEMAHCHNVIEHLDVKTALRMLRESARILQPGGHLVLSSEVVTKKFWETFGHIRPYPPASIIKLLRPDSREEFESLAGFEPVGLFFIGDLHKNKLMYFVSFTLGYFTPLLRREYFLVLRRANS